jgi:hypothetical protein
MSFEDRLRDELQRTAAALPSGSIDFTEVLEQGHRARRRGVAMMAAAAAAVIALAVGAATVLINDNGVSPDPIPPGGTESPDTPAPTPTTPVPTPDDTPTETPSEEGVSFEDVEPTVRAWLRAIQNSDEDLVWSMMTPEAQAEVGREQFDELMLSALPEGMGAFADAPDFHHVVVASAGREAAVVAVVSGDVEREGSVEFGAQAFPVRIVGDEVLIDEVFEDRYADRVAVFASESAGPFRFPKGEELIVTFAHPEGAVDVFISVDGDTAPLRTTFNPSSGEARAILDRDLAEGPHIATVIVQHESGRLYPEAIPFRALAP